MNYYDPNTEIGKNAQAIDSPDNPNELSVGGHGIRGTMNDDSTGTRDFLDLDKLADRLEDPVLAGKLNRAKYVRLYSCHLGEGPSSFAKRLAKRLKKSVIAPDGYLAIGPNGSNSVVKDLTPEGKGDFTKPGTWVQFSGD